MIDAEYPIVVKKDRYITRLELWRDGKVYRITRDRKGRFKKREPAFMYRLTLGINYVVHGNYFSYVMRYWHHNRNVVERKADDLREGIIEAVEKEVGFDRTDWWFEDEPNISIQEVDYDERLIGEQEEEHEELGSK